MVYTHVETLLSIPTYAGARWAAAFGVLVWTIGSGAVRGLGWLLRAGMRLDNGRRPVGQKKNGHVPIGCVTVDRWPLRSGHFGKIGTLRRGATVLRTGLSLVFEICIRRQRANAPSQLLDAGPVSAPAVSVSVGFASQSSAFGSGRLSRASSHNPIGDAPVPICQRVRRTSRGPGRDRRDGSTRRRRSRMRLNSPNLTGTSAVPFYFSGGPDLKSGFHRRAAEIGTEEGFCRGS